MAETERGGVDVNVALAATAHHLLRTPNPSSAGPKETMPAKPAPSGTPATRRSSTPKRLAARLVTPLVRPFCRRLRTHLNEPIRADLERLERSYQAQLTALQSEVQQLRRDLAESDERQRELIESIGWQILRAMQSDD